MRHLVCLIGITLISAQLHGQSIADVARRERERREAEKNSPEKSGPVTVWKGGGRSTSATLPSATVTPPSPTIASPKADESGAPRPAALVATRATVPSDFGAEKDDVFKFYDVHGTTAVELRDELARLGPLSEGERHQAKTDWKITWATTTGSVGGRCSLDDVRISSSIEIILPRWVDEVGAPQALSDVWRNFMKGLLAHEHQHKRIALAGVEEIRKIPKTSGQKQTCAEVVAPYNAAGKAVVDKTVEKQQTFDRETDHGRNQGVGLP